MQIDLVSAMPFGDGPSLQDFAFVHRLSHNQIDSAIQAKSLGALPNATLDSRAAMEVWTALMRHEDVGNPRPLLDWLQLHANLHTAEWLVLGLGQVPDLSIVDFSNEQEFYDWMGAHAYIHDTENQALGIT